MSNYEKAVKELAPCGNDCSRCANYEGSKIVLLSKALNENLENFENMVEKIKGFMPIFNHYEEFLAILRHFSNGNCNGCRLIDKSEYECSINKCHKKEKVNFCFECSKYPCKPTTYNESLTEIWKQNNDTMKKSGIDDFYIALKEKSRY